MNTQLDLMLKALAKSVVSIVDAPVNNRRALLQKTVSQFRSAAVDYIESGLAKAYHAGEGSQLAKSFGKRLTKDHSNIQVMASILAQTEDLLGRLARNSYDNPEMLGAVQSWLANGTALLSEMAGAGQASAAAPAVDDYSDFGDGAVTADDIEAEVEKFARSLTRRLRKAEDSDDEDYGDYEDPDLDDPFDEDEDEGEEEEDAVEKFARSLAYHLRKSVNTEAKKLPEAGSILDNDLDFDLDGSVEDDMVEIASTEASQYLDDDEVTGAAQGSPNLEAEVRKFARQIARRMLKAVETDAEEIPDAGEMSDNDLGFDLDEDPDEDNPVEGDMTDITPTEASQSLEDDEVTGVAQHSPDLEAEVAKFARRLVRKMGAGQLRKQGFPPQGGQQSGGGQQGAPMQGEDMQSQQVDLDSPEIIGRLSAAIFDEAAKLKGAGEQEQAPPQSPAGQGNPMQNQGFGKMSNGALQKALQKAAQNVLGELKNTPAPAKGVLRKVVSKTDDAADLAKSYGIDLEAEAARLEKMDPEARAAELIKFAHRNPRMI